MLETVISIKIVLQMPPLLVSFVIALFSISTPETKETEKCIKNSKLLEVLLIA